MPDEPTPSGDTPAKPQVPYHAWEMRLLEDSEGRRIEFRQLVPNSPDPGQEHFQELTGITEVTIRINAPGGGIDRAVPVPFNIPMGPGGVPGILEAFKVFDILAGRAQEKAREQLEGMVEERKKELRSKIVIPGKDVPMPAGVVKS